MFRGKESSNRIELFRLVQDLLNFGVLGSLQLWGWGGAWMGVGGGWGCPTHMHMYVHTCMHMHAHIHIKHDNFNCKWQPPLGESLGIPYDVICACMHMHVHMCRGHSQPPPIPPGGDPPESVKIQ